MVALALLLVLVVLLAVAWALRKPIAGNYIDREFARRHVQARYTVTHLGFRTQRIENFVIGDPAHPDLTARWVELKLSWGWRRPRVALITARGVRLNGRVVNGRLSLGQVDRLLPPPSGLPFRFPDQNVDVAQTSIRLDTPAGRVGIALEGKGKLSDGFRGRMAAASPALSLGGCRLARPAGVWTVAIDKLRPHVVGPARLESLACGDAAGVTMASLNLDAALAPGLDAWRGAADVKAAAARASGAAMARVGGRLTFDGNKAETRGKLELAAASARIPGFAAGRTGLAGAYSVSSASGRIAFAGDASARGMSGGAAAVRPLMAALSSAGGTPAGPIGDAWAAALGRAVRGFDLFGTLHVVQEAGRGAVRFDSARIASRSGARLVLSGGDGLRFGWPRGGVQIDGNFALSGGGLPAARFALDQSRPGGPISGSGRIAPYSAGGATLALGTLRFSAAPGGVTRIDTVATMDGPLSNGRVGGLTLPVSVRLDGRGGFAFDERCTAASFRFFTTGSLRLGPTRATLCPTGRGLLWKGGRGGVQGGATIAAPHFAGTIGQAPVTIDMGRLRFGLDRPNFTGSDLAVRFGRAGSISRLDLASLSGRFVRGGAVSGTYSGLSGRLANVPLLLSKGAGPWRLDRGNLEVHGSLTVADDNPAPRFYPLLAKDFGLTLIDSRIAAKGWLFDPETGTRIVEADIAHSLVTGTGRVLLDVPGIRFGQDYQPEQLTRLTTGVVALVNGTVEGKAEIGWSPRGSTSSGTFSTKGMNMAASFGPVENLTTSVHFTDLLNLVSAPGQVAEVGTIRTGIDVFDGLVRYQLLAGQRVGVEGGRWPFAGGTLILDPTILDFSRQTAKQLTFRVEGIDAARFIQQMEFANITATGTFDGIIPMVFDERGGRIVGGHLIARPEGGTLSYIGELTDKQLGVYGKLAFDALKSLRYNKLTIDLDGALDGEFVAGIHLDGVARNASVTVAPSGGISGMVAGRALSQLAKIPFKFVIRIRGPFRAVIGTARSLEDPTNLIQSVLPELMRGQPTKTTIVQPKESETVR
jgi:translocation and assembly module TamB